VLHPSIPPQGSLNKIFVAAAGILLFKEATNAGNLASIGVGLAAGALFVSAKAWVVPAPAATKSVAPIRA
jgi:hypothetical protein